MANGNSNSVGGGRGGKTTVTFDEAALGEGQEAPIFTSGGLNFAETGAYNTTEPNDQYGYGQPTSGENIGFIGRGYDADTNDAVVITAADGGDFNLFSANFTGTSDQEVTATAYDDGRVVGVLKFNVEAGETAPVDFTSDLDDARFASIDTLVLTTSNGFFGFDDIVYIG